jgi:peptidoglycan/xylan/chitin deacetylase (PgdA/CDA1 family)/glycosyltransferase involved in cell wall biosynthesis
MTSPLRLSVVIATYNRREVLAQTLPSVLAQDFASSAYEVIVVVDGSTDGTAEWLRSLRPACALRILEQSNGGQTIAQNAGLRAAQGELVLFLDDDILCEANLLQEHSTAHRTGESLVICGPILLAPNSPNTLATDWVRSCTDEYLRRRAEDNEQRWPRDALVDANVSALRSVLLACGGFDERFMRARQDADFGMRLWKMGARFRYRPSAVARQIYVKTTRNLLRKDAPQYGKNEVFLCRKHPDYRPYSALAGLGKGPWWRRRLREIVTRFPVSPEMLLRAPCVVAEQFRLIPWVRSVGIRLLQWRQGIEVLRSALREVGSWEAFQAEFGMRLPVLLYHHVGPLRPGTYPELTVSPEKFERQIRWLARRGYVGVPPSAWLAWCKEGRALPDRPILLTFDDAYADLTEHAFPVLRRYGFNATVFVVTGQMGGTNAWDEKEGSGRHELMTAEQIRYWASQGIEFGAHSRSHADLRALQGSDLTDEVTGSGRDLAELLGTRVLSFAYPYGYHSGAVEKCLESSFALAFGVEEGLNCLQTDLLLLRRTMVQPDDSLSDFAWRVRLGWSPIQRFRARVVRAIRRPRVQEQ